MQSRQRKNTNTNTEVDTKEHKEYNVHKDYKDFSDTDFINDMLDVQEKVYEIERTVQNILLAFTLNDLGHPDTDGHRKKHLKLNEQEKIMEGYKVEATKKILGAIAVFLLGLFSTGFMSSLRAWLVG